MAKYLVLLFHFIGVFTLKYFFYGNVSVEVIAPTEVIAGEEFEVEVIVKKSLLTSFARFEQNLPAGLEAEAVNSANADFSFSDRRVRFIWLRLPPDEEFSFKYKIKVDERLKGDFNLDGKFSYIDNNERRSIEVSPKMIFIIPSPHMDENLVVDIDDFEELILMGGATDTDVKKIACIRQKPKLVNSANEININILVNKEDLEKFAKIEEEIPAGYTAIAGETKDGIFTYKEQMVKFLWMNLPNEKYFVVSYKLIPENGEPTNQLNIEGIFSFIDPNDQTFPIEILERDFEIDELTPTNVAQMLTTVPGIEMMRKEPKTIKTNPLDIPKDSVKVPIIKPLEKDTTPIIDTFVPLVDNTYVKDTPKVVTPVDPIEDPVIPQKDPVTTNNNTNSNIDISNLSNLLEPEEGIYYRVQLAAGHKPVDVKRYFKRLKISDEVKTEVHDNWIKYSIGSYKYYEEARDYRVHIWNTTPISDAFVSAYNSGTRITVQEALMISNQKWLK